ncbi:hypothetical protein PSTT_03453 [Puccinia striiformis]|uniref:Uncharacterized protein n=1 Tax=Puccinia striiformis TaxID=27350 RepID=A0A2S4VWI1_9BASI|nr:hypothetical protein PSTT_03453 [Puccinia striiformis]
MGDLHIRQFFQLCVSLRGNQPSSSRKTVLLAPSICCKTEYSQTRNSPSPVQQDWLQLSRANKVSAVFSVSNTHNCTKARPDISIISPHSRATIYSQINPLKYGEEGNDNDDEKWQKRMDGLGDTIILEQLITTTEEVGNDIE